MKAWKEWAAAFILSIVWYGSGFVQSLSHAVWQRERSLFDKIIIFPVDVYFWIFDTFTSATTVARSNFIKLILIFVSILFTTVLTVAIYEILKRIRHLADTKKIFLLLMFILFLANSSIITPVAALEQGGTITLAFSDIPVENINAQQVLSFSPTHITIVDIATNKITYGVVEGMPHMQPRA